MKMLTPEQLSRRKLGIGGSDIGIICGYTYSESISSKSRTILDIYLSKTSIDNSFVETEQMFWGNKLEDVIANVYTLRTGKSCESIDTVIHPKYDWAIANVDRLISDGGILECKTADMRMAKLWGEPGTDQIPKSYLAQVAWYCMVLDAPYADIAVLVGGNDFRIYKYTRTPSFENLLLRKAEDFWVNHVQKNMPPACTTLRDFDTLYKISETSHDAAVATPQTYDEIDEYLNLQRDLKEKQARLDELKFSILMSMGTRETLVDAHGQIIATYKSIKRKTIDQLKVKDFLSPDSFDQCFKTTESRIFKPRNLTETE